MSKGRIPARGIQKQTITGSVRGNCVISPAAPV